EEGSFVRLRNQPPAAPIAQCGVENHHSLDQAADRMQPAIAVVRRNVKRSPTERIEINPRVVLGKPVIRGTQIPVELILRKLSEGASEADLLEGYPSLKREDIQAAMRYAADTLAHEEVVFIGKGSAERRDYPVRFLYKGVCDYTLVVALRN